MDVCPGVSKGGLPGPSARESGPPAQPESGHLSATTISHLETLDALVQE
jgi:hypothetical protein